MNWSKYRHWGIWYCDIWFCSYHQVLVTSVDGAACFCYLVTYVLTLNHWMSPIKTHGSSSESQNYNQSVLLKEKWLWSSTEAQCHLVNFRHDVLRLQLNQSPHLFSHNAAAAASLFDTLRFFTLCSHLYSVSLLKSSIWSSTELPTGMQRLAFLFSLNGNEETKKSHTLLQRLPRHYIQW